MASRQSLMQDSDDGEDVRISDSSVARYLTSSASSSAFSEEEEEDLLPMTGVSSTPPMKLPRAIEAHTEYDPSSQDYFPTAQYHRPPPPPPSPPSMESPAPPSTHSDMTPLQPLAREVYGGGLYGKDDDVDDVQRKRRQRPTCVGGGAGTSAAGGGMHRADYQSAEGPPTFMNSGAKVHEPPSTGDRDLDITGQSYIQ